MGKQAIPRNLADSEAMSVVRNLRVSPQKLNLVAAMIRGMDVNKAIAALSFSRRRIAGDVKKGLQSAIANAENNHSLDVDRLFVKEAHVGKGLVMKRFRARAKGRGARILKPFSHLTIVVGEKESNRMGQKVKPIGLRVGINRTWDSRWYAGRNYGQLLHQDIKLRKYLMGRLKQAAISRVVIERPAGHARVTIHAGRQG